MDASVRELYVAISNTLGRGGNVIIPTFALERAQELLWMLNQGIEKRQLMPSMQVTLDSPMAISATEIFARHPECLQPEAARLFREGRDPLTLPGLHFTRERAESMALNNVRGGAIIMAGNGMATGGRVRHHLKHNISREECSVIFVGFAADSWGRYPGKSRDPHHQRVLGPRRSGRAIEMAWAYRRRAYVPDPRRGSYHAEVRVATWQNACRNAQP
jgi:Cft2 family RNA processing exonuclease